MTATEPATVSPELLELPIADFAERFRTWLTDHRADLRPLLAPGSDFDDRVSAARRLRRRLWDAGWARYG